MALYELQWTASGRAVIEADDGDEAETILHEGLVNFDTTMFDEFDVDETSTDSCEEQNDDD